VTSKGPFQPKAFSILCFQTQHSQDPLLVGATDSAAKAPRCQRKGWHPAPWGATVTLPGAWQA